MAEWISIKDCLPLKPDEIIGHIQTVDVLVAGNGQVTIGVFQIGLTPAPWGEFSHYCGINPKSITHWMPLPEAPK